MPKRLVVCCDGTWNQPDELNGKHPAPTNVTKLALAIADVDAAGTEQRVFYHPGVGTRRGERIRGGAFGFGLSRDVRDAYRFLVRTFEPGDELFFLGFSRGAFTARSAAGFVRNCGILRPEFADRVDDAYALYRDRRSHPRGVEARLFRKSYAYETRIRFIGVWDTVGALGIPLSGLRLINVINRRWQFHDTDLSTTVDSAYHAIAIDEKRKAFAPTIWKRQPEAGQQVVEQVWFPGVHCDVGGGYAQPALSDVALLWLLDRAESQGLAVDHTALAAGPFAGQLADDGTPLMGGPAPDPLGCKHESRKSFYRLVPVYNRPIGHDCPATEHVSAAALQRRAALPDYRPPELEKYLAKSGDVSPTAG